MTPRDRSLAWTFGLCLGLDQLTKAATVAWLGQGRDAWVLVPGWLRLVQVHNEAAAFGMTGDLALADRRLLYLATTIAMLVGLVVVARLIRPDDAMGGVVVGLGGAGVLGNGLDRLFRGHVIDMVEMQAGHPTLARWLRGLIGSDTWPVYNVADVLLLASVLALAGWLLTPDEPDDEPTAAATG